MRDRRTVLVGRTELGITDHVQDRWWERVKPMLEQDAAAEDLRRVLALAGEFSGPPAWAEPPEPVDAWVTIGGDVAFPVIGGRLVTCLTRGAPSDATRERIAELKRGRRARKSAKRRKRHGKVARREAYDVRSRREESRDGR